MTHVVDSSGQVKLVLASGSGGGTDEKVKVTSDDTTADYLLNKLAVTAPITLTETNPAGDEDATIAVDSATESAEGVSEIATQAETDAGTDDTRFVTPLKLANYVKFKRWIAHDQKTVGTSSGTFTSGAWRTRDLNTEVLDDIGVTLSSNQFSLPAGTYIIEAHAPAYKVDNHQIRLQNITDAVTVAGGSSEASNSAGFTSSRSTIVHSFTIAAAKTFEIQHRCLSTRATNGFGQTANVSGPYELYTIVKLIQVA